MVSSVMWRARRPAGEQTLLGHTSAVLGVAFDPRGGKLASASADNTAIVWDASSGLPLVFGSPWIVGSVILEQQVSVWFNVVIRGDNEDILLGPRSNIQDGSVLHTDEGVPLSVGMVVSSGVPLSKVRRSDSISALICSLGRAVLRRSTGAQVSL